MERRIEPDPTITDEEVFKVAARLSKEIARKTCTLCHAPLKGKEKKHKSNSCNYCRNLKFMGNYFQVTPNKNHKERLSK